MGQLVGELKNRKTKPKARDVKVESGKGGKRSGSPQTGKGKVAEFDRPT